MDWSFAVDPLDVHSNRVDADREDIRDFFVGNALGQTIEDLLLTSGKLLDFLFRTAAFVEKLNDFASDVASHRRIASMDVLDGFDYFCLGRAFQQVTARASQ